MIVISDAIVEAGRTARAAGRLKDENHHRAGSQDSLDRPIGDTDEAEDEA